MADHVGLQDVEPDLPIELLTRSWLAPEGPFVVPHDGIYMTRAGLVRLHKGEVVPPGGIAQPPTTPTGWTWDGVLGFWLLCIALGVIAGMAIGVQLYR